MGGAEHHQFVIGSACQLQGNWQPGLGETTGHRDCGKSGQVVWARVLGQCRGRTNLTLSCLHSFLQQFGSGDRLSRSGQQVHLFQQPPCLPVEDRPRLLRSQVVRCAHEQARLQAQPDRRVEFVSISSQQIPVVRRGFRHQNRAGDGLGVVEHWEGHISHDRTQRFQYDDRLSHRLLHFRVQRGLEVFPDDADAQSSHIAGESRGVIGYFDPR